MKISTKGRYAFALMLDILSNEGDDPVPLKESAKRQEVPEKYLEQIAGTLVKSHMIRSVRGSGGGYHLTRRPEEYTVGDILRVMEGDLAPAPCAEENGTPCKRKDKCTNIILWEKLNAAVNSVIDHITLWDMYGWQQEKEKDHACRTDL